MVFKRETLTTGLSVLISTFLVSSIVLAVTTIGLDISTGGDVSIGGELIVTGTSTFSGNVQIGCTACLTDANVVDNLTISGGVINNTPIGLISSSTAIFTTATTSNLIVTTSLTLPSNSVTDAMVVDNLTINGGTIDNSVIGGTTPAQGTFTNLKANDSLTIGSGGTPIVAHLSATTSITFNLDTPNTCTVATTSLSGAAVGDSVSVGMPEPPTGNFLVSWGGWVQSLNVVALKYCTGAATTTDATYTVRFDVWKH